MYKYWYALKALIRFYCIKIFHTHKFIFTKANLIFPLCVFEFSKDATVKFGYKIGLRRNTQITVRNGGNLQLGDNVFFNANCVITCHSNITIGNNCKFGPGSMLFDHDHNMEDSKSIIHRDAFPSDKIIIGEGCWFGAGCIILKGTVIGDHCVFGAGTIIKGNYESNSIVVQKRQSTVRFWNDEN